MKNIKKTLTIAGVICIICTILPAITMLTDWLVYQELTVYGVVVDILEMVLSLITGITYLVLSRKSQDYLADHRNIFLTFTLLNIFNGIIVWVVAFWVEITVSQLSRIRVFNEQPTTHANDQGDRIYIQPDEYTAISKMDMLADELKRIEVMRNNGDITPDEYDRLRQRLLDKFAD